MAMNNRLMRPKKSGAAPFVYNAEALAWETTVIANGGTVSTSTKQAVSTFCDAIDAAGIRSKFLRLNLVCGGNLAAARTPLYRGPSSTSTQYGSAIDTNIGPYAEENYGESSGLTSATYTKCLDITVGPGDLFAFGGEYNNCHLSLYNRTMTSAAEPFAVFTTDELYFGIILSRALLVTYSSYEVVSATSGGFGLELAQWNDTSADYLLNNQSVKTAQDTTESMQSFDSQVGTLAVGGVRNAQSDVYAGSYGSFSAYSVGKAFTSAAQLTAFYNAMIAFQTALGRNV